MVVFLDLKSRNVKIYEVFDSFWQVWKSRTLLIFHRLCNIYVVHLSALKMALHGTCIFRVLRSNRRWKLGIINIRWHTFYSDVWKLTAFEHIYWRHTLFYRYFESKFSFLPLGHHLSLIQTSLLQPQRLFFSRWTSKYHSIQRAQHPQTFTWLQAFTVNIFPT